jgi:hypothetical protein
MDRQHCGAWVVLRRLPACLCTPAPPQLEKQSGHKKWQQVHCSDYPTHTRGLLLISFSQNTQRELKYIKNTHYKVKGSLCLLPSKLIIQNFSLNVALDKTARTGWSPPRDSKLYCFWNYLARDNYTAYRVLSRQYKRSSWKPCRIVRYKLYRIVRYKLYRIVRYKRFWGVSRRLHTQSRQPKIPTTSTLEMYLRTKMHQVISKRP